MSLILMDAISILQMNNNKNKILVAVMHLSGHIQLESCDEEESN